MKAIVAVDENWGIGLNNELLFHIKEDMENFRRITTDGVIVMGRKTFESLPNKAPLKNRVNIIITTNKDYKIEGAIVVHDMEELVIELANYDTNDVYIIGGSTIYKQLLYLCEGAIVTKVHETHEADSFFPDLDKDTNWNWSSRSAIPNTNAEIIHYYNKNLTPKVFRV